MFLVTEAKKNLKNYTWGDEAHTFLGGHNKKMIARFWSPLFKQLSKNLLGNKPTNIAPMKYISAHRPLFLTFFSALSRFNKKLEGQLKKREMKLNTRTDKILQNKKEPKNLFFLLVKKKQCLSYSKKIFFGVGPETMRHDKKTNQ